MRYTIKKGHFSSGFHLGLHTGRVNQTYKVRFDSSCLYEDIDWERDWNKLNGWSYSNLPFRLTHESLKEEKVSYTIQPGHHRNSIRLAWRANKSLNKIELAGYYYQDGVRFITDVFALLDVDKEYTVGIFYKEDNHKVYYSDTDANEFRLVFTCTQKDDAYFATKSAILIKPYKIQASYNLFPYFGGSNPAPQTMIIYSTETW